MRKVSKKLKKPLINKKGSLNKNFYKYMGVFIVWSIIMFLLGYLSGYVQSSCNDLNIAKDSVIVSSEIIGTSPVYSHEVVEEKGPIISEPIFEPTVTLF